ncbi:MAG: putative toxin-antitoxin system toxin component, PIN family [Bacteroidales bacterium]|nr:putative toxin-antitoxin system toxin component, PIN family [Bacteroidales bacterium]
MVCAVIDTNVLVSSLLSRHPDSGTVVIRDYILSGRVIPLYNDEIFQEYVEVLHRPRLGLPGNLVDSILDTIKAVGISLDRTPANEPMTDPKDIVFYEIALSKDDAWLITGNKRHFPNSPIVVTPAEFLAIISHSAD